MFGQAHVAHMLLWREEKKQIGTKVTRSTDVKKVLGSKVGATAAIRLALATGLLGQVQSTRAPEYKTLG